jgi:hypothetical protein
VSASWFLWGVPVAAGLVALYSALGGPALWRRGERSDRVIGRTIFLRGVEGLDGHSALPSGVIASYDLGWYVVNLEAPLVTDAGEVRALRVAARHRGYPISAASSRSAVAVNGELSTGRQFIAFARVSTPNNRWRGP